MKLTLIKKPKNARIIAGFPGFGLVSTIATEFLLEHLKMEKIGTITSDDIPAMIAVHQGKVVDPIGLFYNKKYNILLVHVVSTAMGIEWKLGEVIYDLAKELDAKEILSLEGIGSTKPSEDTRSFYFASEPSNEKKLKDVSEPLKEGIIMGLTGVLMLKAHNNIPVTCIFAEAHSELPDSKAAAKIITILDSYIGLKLDPKPLLEQAEKFEQKLKQMMSQTKEMSEEQRKKRLSYVG